MVPSTGTLLSQVSPNQFSPPPTFLIDHTLINLPMGWALINPWWRRGTGSEVKDAIESPKDRHHQPQASAGRTSPGDYALRSSFLRPSQQEKFQGAPPPFYSPLFCMKLNRSSRNSFLLGSASSSYSWGRTKVILHIHWPPPSWNPNSGGTLDKSSW